MEAGGQRGRARAAAEGLNVDEQTEDETREKRATELLDLLRFATEPEAPGEEQR